MSFLHAFHAPRRRLLAPSATTHLLKPCSYLCRRLPSPTYRFNIPLTMSRPFTASSMLSLHLPRKKGRARRRRGGKRGAPRPEMRITLIRYFLMHPKQPRPLRFSRNRALRHWTIHRAWMLYQNKLRQAQQLSLERQFNSMREACEALRLIGEDGLAITQPGKAIPPPGARDIRAVVIGEGDDKIELDVQAAAEQQREVGKLFRIAMLKTGVWDGVPIEYSRHQTDSPPRDGWDHNWIR